jgi:hypothetical protein
MIWQNDCPYSPEEHTNKQASSFKQNGFEAALFITPPKVS